MGCGDVQGKDVLGPSDKGLRLAINGGGVGCFTPILAPTDLPYQLRLLLCRPIKKGSDPAHPGLFDVNNVSPTGFVRLGSFQLNSDASLPRVGQRSSRNRVFCTLKGSAFSDHSCCGDVQGVIEPRQWKARAGPVV